MTQIKGVVFDRDGTLIQHVAYLSNVADVCILPGVVDALHILKRAGILCFIATNQSGIGRGFYTEAQYKQIEAYLDRLFDGHGIAFERTYYCPFHPTEGIGHYLHDSMDRKPNPGMIQRVMSDFNLQPTELVMVGDSGVDIGAAQKAGVRSVFVTTGVGEGMDVVQPDYRSDSLLDSVQNYIMTL